MTDDDYEILPHHEPEYLRHEVEKLKKNPMGDTGTAQTLLDSMNGLTLAINKLLNVLESANDEIIKDYHENKTSMRMDRLAEQNHKLAEGMVAVGELVKQVLNTEKRNAAFRGGFAELSDFTTDLKRVKSNKPHAQSKNPFMNAPDDGVHIDTSNLPRASFASMDNQNFNQMAGRDFNNQSLNNQQQSPGMFAPMGMPPPPSGATQNDLPPSFQTIGPDGKPGLPPINDDDVPPPPR